MNLKKALELRKAKFISKKRGKGGEWEYKYKETKRKESKEEAKIFEDIKDLHHWIKIKRMTTADITKKRRIVVGKKVYNSYLEALNA